MSDPSETVERISHLRCTERGYRIASAAEARRFAGAAGLGVLVHCVPIARRWRRRAQSRMGRPAISADAAPWRRTTRRARGWRRPLCPGRGCPPPRAGRGTGRTAAPASTTATHGLVVVRQRSASTSASAPGRARSSAWPAPAGSVSIVSVIGTTPTIPTSTSSASRIDPRNRPGDRGVRDRREVQRVVDVHDGHDPGGDEDARPARAPWPAAKRASSRVPAWSAIVTHSEPALLAAPSRRARRGPAVEQRERAHQVVEVGGRVGPGHAGRPRELAGRPWRRRRSRPCGSPRRWPRPPSARPGRGRRAGRRRDPRGGLEEPQAVEPREPLHVHAEDADLRVVGEVGQEVAGGEVHLVADGDDVARVERGQPRQAGDREGAAAGDQRDRRGPRARRQLPARDEQRVVAARPGADAEAVAAVDHGSAVRPARGPPPARRASAPRARRRRSSPRGRPGSRSATRRGPAR